MLLLHALCPDCYQLKRVFSPYAEVLNVFSLCVLCIKLSLFQDVSKLLYSILIEF